MKNEDFLILIVAMLLFGALFAYIQLDCHKITWKGMDSLRAKGELLEFMIQRMEKNTIVVHDTIFVHDTVFVEEK